jgi:hypothetical protein
VPIRPRRGVATKQRAPPEPPPRHPARTRRRFGVVALRLIVKTVKVGLLLAAPALIYLLHMR